MTTHLTESKTESGPRECLAPLSRKGIQDKVTNQAFAITEAWLQKIVEVFRNELQQWKISRQRAQQKEEQKQLPLDDDRQGITEDNNRACTHPMGIPYNYAAKGLLSNRSKTDPACVTAGEEISRSSTYVKKPQCLAMEYKDLFDKTQCSTEHINNYIYRLQVLVRINNVD